MSEMTFEDRLQAPLRIPLSKTFALLKQRIERSAELIHGLGATVPDKWLGRVLDVEGKRHVAIRTGVLLDWSKEIATETSTVSPLTEWANNGWVVRGEVAVGLGDRFSGIAVDTECVLVSVDALLGRQSD